MNLSRLQPAGRTAGHDRSSHCAMPLRHRQFLFGFERRAPDGSLLHVSNALDFPAVRWREQNLDTLMILPKFQFFNMCRQSLAEMGRGCNTGSAGGWNGRLSQGVPSHHPSAPSFALDPHVR